jgi:glutamate-1-semialdehyde 2,1-aminomutase
MLNRTERSQADAMTNAHTDMLKRAHAVLPGASLGSYFIPSEQDMVVASARGAYMTDVAGRTYLDYILSSGPMIVGHANPVVNAAVREQLELGTSYYAINQPSIELAEELVASTPGTDMVKFCSSGSEATFFALRLARGFTGRNRILKFEGAYHGSHDYALMSMYPAKEIEYPAGIPDSAGLPQGARDSVLIAPFNDIERTLDIIRAHAADLAAIIIEPEMRLIPPKPGFLKALREAADAHGILLVFDEVVMGFRLTYGSVQQIYGVQPDLVAYGKIIGGGYPLAAVVGRTDIMRLSNPRERAPNYVYVSGTLSGNPLAAAAGLATLRELKKPGVYESLNAAGRYLRDGLAAVAHRLNMPAQVLGSGPMANIYFTDREITDYRSGQCEDKALKQRLRVALLERGFLTNPAQKLYLSTEHKTADIDRTLEAIEDSLRSFR